MYSLRMHALAKAATVRPPDFANVVATEFANVVATDKRPLTRTGVALPVRFPQNHRDVAVVIDDGGRVLGLTGTVSTADGFTGRIEQSTIRSALRNLNRSGESNNCVGRMVCHFHILRNAERIEARTKASRLPTRILEQRSGERTQA
jgi:hypothetical protein